MVRSGHFGCRSFARQICPCAPDRADSSDPCRAISPSKTSFRQLDKHFRPDAIVDFRPLTRIRLVAIETRLTNAVAQHHSGEFCVHHEKIILPAERAAAFGGPLAPGLRT